MVHYGDWIAMAVMMVVFWGFVAVLVVWVVYTLRPAPRAEPDDKAAPSNAGRR